MQENRLKNDIKIENTLSAIKDEIQKFSTQTKQNFERLVRDLQTEEIQDIFQHFQEIEVNKISTKVLQAIQTIDSPIYVGLLGRYSHGKTALINQFFSMTQDYALPEGDGIVTSKVTEITFLNEDFGLPQCLEVSRDGSQTKVNIEELKKSVKASNSKDLNQINPAEIVDFYSIKLSAQDAFSKLFATKKINLIDVPGLGSPYATDKHIIEMYIKKVDMLIVAIKVTEIQEAANAIEPFLRNQRLSIPIIPVLTFFDIWQNSDSLASCRNEEEAIDKAKKIIEEKIPSLSGYENRTLAISSKTGANINELRECILNFVETPEMAIVKGRKKTPELLSKKIGQISRELDQITIDIDNSNDKLQKQIQSLIPQQMKGRSSFENFEKDLQRDKARLISDSKQRIDRSINNIFLDVRTIDQEIVYLRFDEIKQRMRKIEEGVNERLQQLENDEIKELFDNFKIDLINKVDRYFASVSDTEIQDLAYLKESIIRDIQYKDYQQLGKGKYQVPNINVEIAMGTGKTIIDVVLTNITNPQVILPLIAIPVLMQIKGTIIGSIPGIGQSLDILLPGCCIALVWQVISKKNTERIDGAKRDIMQKLLASFNKQIYCDNYSKCFEKNINEIIVSTNLKMRDPQNPYFNSDISPISINYLINFRKKIDSIINKFTDPLTKDFFSSSINTLFLSLAPNDDDINKRGIYKAIILGMDDSSMIDQFIGVNTFGLTSNDNYYLISICRTIREQSLQIDFTKSTSLTAESKRVIASIFRQKCPTIDIDKFLANGKIPSLIIKIDLSFLENLDDDIRLLKATELIEKITLNVFFDSGDNVLSLCRQIDIFTSRYIDKLHSSLSLNPDAQFSISDCYYNLAILNGKNDYLIKYFLDLFSYYEDKLKLDRLSRKSLENIFYALDRDVIKQTRLLEEKPKYKEGIREINFSNEIDKRHSYHSILFILNCIQYHIVSEIKNDNYTKDKIAASTKTIVTSIKKIFNRAELINEKVNGDIQMQLNSTLHTIFNPENDKYVLREISELLSSEILSIMIEKNGLY